MLKLLMTWNIREGLEDEYFEFVMQGFGPGMLELGIQPTDAWYTAYGDHPQILTGGIAKDWENMQKALASEKWRRLKEELMVYVKDYEEKVVHADGGFQL